MLLKRIVAEISSRDSWDKMKPLFCQDRRMDQAFKCQVDWCLSNWKRWPSVGLFVLLRWLLAAKGLVLAFRRWSVRTCKAMKFHRHKLQFTGKRMKFSVSILAGFLCFSVQTQLLGSSLCFVQSGLFFCLWTYERLKMRWCLLWWDQPGK